MGNFNRQFYETEYHGSSIPLDQWDHYAKRAEAVLQHFMRMYKITAPIDMESGQPDEDAIIYCLCSLADTVYGYDLYDSGESGPLTSIKTGEVSASYASNGVDLSEKGRTKTLYNVIKTYLDVYRGVE